jgi:orotidine-5'-phosphate decarboxylase
MNLVEKLKDSVGAFKIGMQLYNSEGPDIVRDIQERGGKVFVDLKFHDIPNTVAAAMRSLGELKVDMVNLHAGGGMAMMRQAVEALNALGADKPLVIAVTILTSLSPDAVEQELLIGRTLPDTVLHYAKNAKEAGLDGVVCSPLEAASVHQALGSGFVTVTPGIRFADGEKGDQQRVTTPEQARQIGSDYIVVGRPITKASDPVSAYRRCIREFVSA